MMFLTCGSLTGGSSACCARSRFSCSISASSARSRSSTLLLLLAAKETQGPVTTRPAIIAAASHLLQSAFVFMVVTSR